MIEILLAKWVLPICTGPIEDGAVAIDGSSIVDIGEAKTVIAGFPDATCHDFGMAAILPGLVNCHSHLELTVMRGFLEREEHDFFRWLKKLGSSRYELLNRNDLFISAVCGAIEAARAGITCLGGDASDEASASHTALREVGLRGIVYQEVFGPDAGIAAEKLQSLQNKIKETRAVDTGLVRTGVSPHAPYTVSPLLLRSVVEYAVAEQLPIMMHAAESKSEEQFIRTGSGPFADGLRARNIDFNVQGCSTI
ncbi:MAG: amidohydrolase family protein, partial [Pyrinomonadaceae bacterium]